MATENQELVEAVAAWLHYKELTGLRGLLNEASMTLPIAEFLAAKHGKEIRGEVAHPLFKTHASGRPKQVDFVRMRHGGRTWFAAYECKFMKINQALIVNDICRLVCLSQSREDIGAPERYFIFAGGLQKDSLISHSQFNTGEGERRSFFADFLSENLENPAISFRISDLHPRQRQCFINFAKSNKADLPSIVVSDLQGWAVSGSVACGIWRITQAMGSVLLSSKEMRKQ